MTGAKGEDGPDAVEVFKKEAAAFNAIVDHVENRCMAADGPVTPTLKEMTEKELAILWQHVQAMRAGADAMLRRQAEVDGQIEELKDDLAALSSYVGSGLPDEVDTTKIVGRIRDGIEMLTKPLAEAFHRYLYLRRIGVAPAGAEETLDGDDLDRWLDAEMAQVRTPSLPKAPSP